MCVCVCVCVCVHYCVYIIAKWKYEDCPKSNACQVVTLINNMNCMQLISYFVDKALIALIVCPEEK